MKLAQIKKYKRIWQCGKANQTKCIKFFSLKWIEKPWYIAVIYGLKVKLKLPHSTAFTLFVRLNKLWLMFSAVSFLYLYHFVGTKNCSNPGYLDISQTPTAENSAIAKVMPFSSWQQAMVFFQREIRAVANSTQSNDNLLWISNCYSWNQIKHGIFQQDSDHMDIFRKANAIYRLICLLYFSSSSMLEKLYNSLLL